MHKAILIAVLLVITPKARALEIDFVRDVRPILQRHCYSCHGEAQQKSGLRLDIKSEAFDGGDAYGPTLIAGHADESPLIELVTSPDADSRMPPKGAPLTAAEIDTLTSWINEGAPWPEGVDLAKVKDRRDHWSFKPLSVPDGNLSIDHFIDAKLDQHDLERSPPADPHTLVRRLHLDLIGLPPTHQQVVDFIREPDVASLVKTLLASPRYGERWAQHWLDVIRWAETVGFETNAERRNAWPYRDWVIASLNEDKPYDRFLFEQIAGDTVGEDAALGFLVAGPANLPGQIGRDQAAMRGARQDELDEVIRTVSQAFLGLTIGCARCHDHKFDPILERDYYSMQAIFAGLSYGSRRLHGTENDDWASQVPAARDDVMSLRRDLDSLRRKHQLREPIADVHTESFEPVLSEAIRMKIHRTVNGAPASLYEFEVLTREPGDEEEWLNVALATGGATPSASSFALANQSRHFDNLIDGSIDKRQSYPWVAAKNGPAWFRVDFLEPVIIERVTLYRGASMPADFVIEVLSPGSDEWREVAHTRDRLPRTDDTRKVETVQIASLTADETKSILDLLAAIQRAESRLARLAEGPQVYAASFAKEPAATYLLHRGDAMQRRDQVGPAIPEFLGKLDLPANPSEPDARLALARHLIGTDHPLTAHVIVNRIWHHHFGIGLVETPSDFGRTVRPLPIPSSWIGSPPDSSRMAGLSRSSIAASSPRKPIANPVPLGTMPWKSTPTRDFSGVTRRDDSRRSASRFDPLR